MSGVLNKLEEGVYIDNYGKKHNVKEMYYISAGNKLRIGPQDTGAEEVELRRLNDAGYEMAKYKVQQSSELNTTYYIDGNGNKLIGLPPGKYAMVATIVHSSLEIIDKRATECGCTHLTNDGLSSGNQIQFISSGSLGGFNEANKTKSNPFTMEHHEYSVIEILDGDIDVEQIRCPFMYYFVRKNNNGFEGFMVGAIPGSNTAPLRIVRETPNTSFEVGTDSNDSTSRIGQYAIIENSILLYPKYKIAGSDIARTYDASFTVPSQNGYVGKYGSKLLVNKNPVGQNKTISINLSYSGKTSSFSLILRGKIYRLNVAGSTYAPGSTFTLQSQKSAIPEYCGSGSSTGTTASTTGYSVDKTYLVSVSGMTLTPVGYGTAILTIKTVDGAFTGNINAECELTGKLFQNGSFVATSSGKVKPGNETPEIIQINQSGTYELKIYQGETEVSYTAGVVSSQGTINGNGTPSLSQGSSASKIGGNLNYGSSAMITYVISAKNLSGLIQFVINATY